MKKNPAIVKIHRWIIIMCIYLLCQGHWVETSWHLAVSELYMRCFIVNLELMWLLKAAFCKNVKGG